MITLVSMIEAQNPDFGDIRFGVAPAFSKVNPGDSVETKNKIYRVIAAATFYMDSEELKFIMDTFGRPLELDGIWRFDPFKKEENHV